MTRLVTALTLLVACDRADEPRAVRAPREALRQLVACTFDGTGPEPPTARFEGAMRQSLRADRARFAERAGTCESALETPGGAHACLAAFRARWAVMLRVVQRPVDNAIDRDVAVRRAGEAYAGALRACP